MEARVGYGKMRTSRRPSGTSLQDRANQWKFTWETCCSVPLLNSCGSVSLPASTPMSRTRTADTAHRSVSFCECGRWKPARTPLSATRTREPDAEEAESTESGVALPRHIRHTLEPRQVSLLEDRRSALQVQQVRQRERLIPDPY